MSDSSGAPPPLACASYTHARRHPLVLGKIGGWAPPFQLSIAQLLVLGSGLGVLAWTWELWARGPRLVNLVVLGGLPALAAWAVRHARIEGRDALRTLAGVVSWASAPRGGALGGRPARLGRVSVLRPVRVFVRRQAPGPS